VTKRPPGRELSKLDTPLPESSNIDVLPGGFVARRPLDEDPEQSSFLGILGGYWAVLMRRKLVAVAVLALTLGAGYLWLQQQTPIYRATAKVIINYDPPKVWQNVRDVVELGSPKEYRGQLTYFETQYKIIKSFEIAEMVLDREGLWNDPHLLGLDQKKDMSPAEIQHAMESMHQPSVLSDRIGVRPVPNSMMVFVDIEDPDPEFAQRLVNAVAKAYKDQNVSYKQKIVAEATTDLASSLEAKKHEVEDATSKLIAFEQENNAGSISASKDAIDERMKKLNEDLTDALTMKFQLEAQWTNLEPYAKAGGDPFRAKSSVIQENEVIRILKAQIVTVQSELAALRARYLDKHPDVIAKEQQLATLTGIARKEVQSSAQAVGKKLDEVRDVESKIRAQLEDVRKEQQSTSILALEYDRKSDQKKQLEDTELNISKRLSEMRESSKFEANNVRLLDEAIKPAAPFSPRRGLVLAGAFVLGILLAFAAALLVDYADATVKDWKDLEDRLGHKVLGVVPVIGAKTGRQMTPEERRERDLYIFQNPSSNVAEASRSLRTNLLFMSTSQKIDSLLITSASPSEGKSMMAAHVATSVAASGARVLLIEADMRRPRLANSFKVRTDVGLSTALVGLESIDRYTQKTEIPNLDLLPCGPVPPNPAELLHTPRFAELLADMKRRYDTIIFDSPPILPVADALVLAQQVDGVLVVVRAGQTSRHALRHALRNLATVEAPVLGAVLNYQTHKKGGGYGYGYGYGYGDGGYRSKTEAEVT